MIRLVQRSSPFEIAMARSGVEGLDHRFDETTTAAMNGSPLPCQLDDFSRSADGKRRSFNSIMRPSRREP